MEGKLTHFKFINLKPDLKINASKSKFFHYFCFPNEYIQYEPK